MVPRILQAKKGEVIDHLARRGLQNPTCFKWVDNLEVVHSTSIDSTRGCWTHFVTFVSVNVTPARKVKQAIPSAGETQKLGRDALGQIPHQK